MEEKVYQKTESDRLKTQIDIPFGYTLIGESAFDGCSSLQSITIPDSVTSIGSDAFYKCSGLQSITIPEGVTSIGYQTFSGCSGLKEFNVSPNNKMYKTTEDKRCLIDKNGELVAFAPSGLESYVIPDSVTSIRDNVFHECSSLKSLTIPDSVTSIGGRAFSYCSNLQSITIGDNVTSIEGGAFSRCYSLQSITIPEGVTSIGWHTFDGCSSLQSITIPDSVTSIGSEAFAGCSSLQSITIPEGVTSIEEDTFYGCSSLQSITIGDSVTSIENWAFAGCSSLQSITIPDGVTSIGWHTFDGCSSLQSITIPDSVTSIGNWAFDGCSSLQSITIPDGVTSIADNAFDGCFNLKKVILKNGIENIGGEVFNQHNFKYIYFDRKTKDIILSKEKDSSLEKTCWCEDYSLNNFQLAMDHNYKNNHIDLLNWKEEKKIKFIPPDYTIKVFPNSELEKYFLHNNNQRWGKLVKTLGFDNLEGTEKNNSLTDLMKIYYAIGGFSENQGESERAYDYILKYVAVSKNPNATPQEIGAEIHSRFSRISLNGQYCKEFAKFFMKYYKDNPDFMNFRLKNRYGDLMDNIDYLCNAHNSFERILKTYPNRVVNGNEERALLSPRFVAEHCSIVEYKGVEEGNEALAELIGKYGYNQNQFERMQQIYNKAKKIKDKYIITADKSLGVNGITFRILEKDDPLGFVIGDLTNCCQHIGGAGESCVDDGYTNPEAGFIVFEESETDEKGNLTGETIILGQAYVWYDSKTKTVCFDNIEIPSKIIDKLKSKEKNKRGISSENLMKVVKESAFAIMKKMNEKGINVERVTVGRSYNDLNNELSKNFKIEKKPVARNKKGVYTDASEAQYILLTYDEFTKDMANKIKSEISKTKNEINSIKSNENNHIVGG